MLMGLGNGVVQELDAGFPKLALLCVCCQAGRPEVAEGLLQVSAVVLCGSGQVPQDLLYR